MEAMSDSEDDLRKLQVTLYTKLVITCIIEHYVALKEVESKKSPLNNKPKPTPKAQQTQARHFFCYQVSAKLRQFGF